MGFTELTVIFTLGICLRFCTSNPHGGEKWVRPGTYSQNNHQSTLLGIEQKVRGIDSILNTLSHYEVSLDTISHRMELLGTRLIGIHNTIQHKFDAIATATSDAEMKFEHLIDQMTRKLQTDIEKINHKLNSAEARLETTVNKIQNQMEINFQKVETKQNNIANEILRVHSGMDILKSQTINSEERYNRTLGILVNHLQEIRHEQAHKKEHLKNLTSLVTGLHINRGEGWAQSDAPTMPGQQIQIIKAEISNEAQKISSKMSNMYNDMWKNIKDLEVIFKIALNENNNKSRELNDEFIEMLIEEKKNSESFLDIIIHSVIESNRIIETKISDLQRRINSDFQRLIASGELQHDTCNELKGIMENGIPRVLERIYETLTNRSDRFSKQITDMGELMKAEGKQLSTAIIKTNQNVITLAKESSHDHKQLDSTITEVADKTDDISMNTQEIQMQAQEINETFLKHQKSLKELKGVLYNIFENKGNKSLNLPNDNKSNNLSVIEANYSNGIIKILTDHANKNEEFTGKEDTTSHGIQIPLSKLNRTVITSDLVAVIGESKNTNHETSTSAIPSVSAEKDRDRDDDDDFDAQEEFGEDDTKNVDSTQLLLSYIKYLRGHLTPQEFLSEAVPGSKYENLWDMAKQLKRAGNIPKEMINNIEDMAQEQTDKDSNPTDKEIHNIIRKLRQKNKYETINEEENYDDPYDASQRK